MLPIFAKALCCLELFGCYCRRLSQRGVGEVLILLRHCVCVGSGSFCHDWASHCSVLFWSFDALFVFGLPLPSPLSHAPRRALCTLAGTWEQIRTKILRAFGGMMAGPLVATCLGTPSNSIIVSRVPVGQKNLKRLVSAIETENLKNLKTAVHLVNCIVN